jgi:MFS family permease
VTRRAAVGCAPALLGALDFGFLVLAAPALAADLELGSAYGWLFSAGSLAYGAVVMPAETLLARVAASRVLAAGLAVAAAGLVVVASAGDVAAALAGRVLFGAGTGAAAAPALVLLAEEDASASFARMGGAIALGFSTGVVLATAVAWRTALIAVTATAVTAAAATTVPAGRRRRRGTTGAPPGGGTVRGARRGETVPALRRGGTVRAARPGETVPAVRRGGTAGALRLGAATAAAGAAFALVPADAFVGGVALAVAAALAASACRSVRRRVSARSVLVACAAGAATTMSGVSAMVLVGLELTGTPSPADDLALALFGLATPVAVAAARRLSGRLGATGTAVAGLAVQALAIVALASAAALLVPAVALFGAAHVVANGGAAAAVMRSGGAATAAGLFATAQYLAAGAGPLVVPSLATAAAVALAGALAVAACQTQPARRSP